MINMAKIWFDKGEALATMAENAKHGPTELFRSGRTFDAKDAESAHALQLKSDACYAAGHRVIHHNIERMR